MDAGSIIVLVIVAALLACAVRYMLKKGKGGCSDCSDEGCAFHGTDHEPPAGEVLADGKPVSCPVAERAVAAVEAKLGPAGDAAETPADASAKRPV